MRPITIGSDDYGLIGMAADYKSAVKYLIDKEYICENYIILDADNDGEEITIRGKLGINWKDRMINEWDIEKFRKFVYGIYLEEAPIIEY